MSKNTKLANQVIVLLAAQLRVKKAIAKQFHINWNEVNDSDLDHKDND